MTSPAMHMMDLLVTKGFKLAATFPGDKLSYIIYYGKLPSNPDRCIVLYDAGGLAPNPRWLLDYPSVQMRVRGGPNDQRDAYAMAVKARNAILGIESFDAPNGDRIVHVNGIGDVALTGWDDEKRPEFTTNFRLITEPALTPESNREPL